MTYRFGSDNATEENIRNIVTEAIEQTERNIEEERNESIHNKEEIK